LATGGFGQTYIAEDTRRPGNPICVVKHLKPVSTDEKIFVTAKRLFHSEAETLERLGNHDQIPRLLAYFDENQEFFLVQEYIDGHTLNEELIPGQPWSQNQVMQMLLEVLGVLDFVHQQGVIHRDIKPDNIIRRVADYKLVLVDFGAVKQLRSPMVAVGGVPSATVAIGTPGYMSTEQGQGKPRPNSDLYSLGIIAIQALTGIPAHQLPEDPNTGEIHWQHLRPVNPELAEILTKMVRYHFKDRYQTAGEALQACREFVKMNYTSATISEPPQQISYQPPRTLSQVSSQQTVAVAPANPVIPQSIYKPSREQSKPDLLPLVIGLLLAGGAAALVSNLYPNLKNVTANWTDNKSKLGQDCVAVVAPNSNIRSEPSAITSDNILKTLGDPSDFQVTGQRTKLGWVGLKLKSGRSAWAHSEVIINNQQWISCLRDQGVSIQTVDDRALIASRPVPKAKPVAATPEPEESKSSPIVLEDNKKAEIVANARKKFEAGDLQGAIAQLRTIPENAASGFKETVEIVNQWKEDWDKAEALANEINKAIDNGQWDKVLSYRDHPEKLPDIKYWQDKFKPLFKQAADQADKADTSANENEIGNNTSEQKSQTQLEQLQNNQDKDNNGSTN
jgi:serine/threonine-protein kinase